MKILICPDKFKESLTAREAADCIQRGILSVYPEADCDLLPMADGGEGTVDAMVNATKGRLVKVRVHDPLMRSVESFFGISGDGKRAFIEMSAASGLALLKPRERNPMIATSHGTGELIREALKHHCDEIIIGIGGSATVDGGVGMAQALGIRFTDEFGNEVGKGGASLARIRHIDFSPLDERIKECRIIAASDVTNVLTGSQGAAYVFGPQKGANEEQVKFLDENLSHLAALIKETTGKDVNEIQGAGAAGGIGAGILAFLGGEIRNGFDVIAEATNLEVHIRNSDLVMTGEGKIDNQTMYGKTPAGVARLAVEQRKPVIAFAGALGSGADELYRIGISALVPIADKPMSLEESVKNAGILLETAAKRVFRLIMINKKTQG
jgi:glycerate kinase